MKLFLKKKRIALIFGGTGAEHSVSVRSAENLMKLLWGGDFIILPTYISKGGTWTLYPPSKSPLKIERGEAFGIKTYPIRLGCKSGLSLPGGVLKIDGAIPLLHGEGGEDGVVQGALECAGISYLGADVSASALAHNKAYTKTFAESLGIPTLPWIYTECKTEECDILELLRRAEEKLGYPMFIKPATRGSSLGCCAVYSRAEFAPAYRLAYAASGGRVLIEKMLQAPKELEVAYISVKGKEIFTKPGEITYNGGFYSYEKKYADTSGVTVNPTAVLPRGDAELIDGYSRLLLRALGVRHICRIDYFYHGGKIYFNEINTMPGLTDTSLYTSLISHSGISPEQTAVRLAESALGV